MVQFAAPQEPSEIDVVLHGGREARYAPPSSAQEAVELLSNFFDARRQGADNESDEAEESYRSGVAAAMTSDDIVGKGKLENGRGRGVFGTRLLPARYHPVGIRGLSDARMWMVA